MPISRSLLDDMGFNRFNVKTDTNLSEVLNNEVPLSETNEVFKNSSIDLSKLTIDTFQVNQWIRGGATGYDEGTGWWLGHDGSDYKFFIGNSTGNKITWDGTTLSITGSLIAGDIHIPDLTTANSFHTNTGGNSWWGCNVADFNTDNNNAIAYVLNTGVVKFQSGTVGGWTLSTTTLASGTNVVLDASNKAISINSTTWQAQGVQLQYNAGTPRAYIGDGGVTATDYYIMFDGTNISWNAVATSLSTVGLLTTTSANIGGWLVDSTTIKDNATLANAKIVLDSSGGTVRVGATTGDYLTLDGANLRLRSSNYVSGFAGAGFTLEPNLLEVGNIACRGLLRTYVLQKDIISVNAGSLLVVPNSDVLDADMTALDASTLTIKGTVTFAVNDILRIKDGTDDEWLLVTNIASAPIYTVTRDLAGVYVADTNPTWKKGACVANYGQSGDGGLYLTASDTNNPYLSVFTHAGAPWTTLTTQLRLGNLNGYLGYVADIYGFGVGSSSGTNANITIDPTNGIRLRQGTTNKITFDNSGNATLLNLTVGGALTIGTGGSLSSGQTNYNTGTGYWFDYNTGTPRFSIGDGSTNYMTWDGTTLSIAGTISVTSNPQLPTDETLVGYWAFDEASGSTSLDGSVNNYNGTITGCTYGAGVSGTSLIFPGNNTGYYVSTDYRAIDGLDDFTINIWVKLITGVSTAPTVFSCARAGDCNEFLLLYTEATGLWTIYCHGGAKTFSNSTIIDGVLHMMTITREGTNLKLYLDASQIGTTQTVSTDALDVDLGGFIIGQEQDSLGGGFQASQSWSGNVDEFRVYNKVLTSSEIKALYLYPSGVTQQGVKQLGGKYSTAATGARVQLFPDTNTGILAEDASGNDVFKVVVDGTDTGDVVMGDETSDSYAKWDESASEFIVKGSLGNLITFTAGENITEGDAIAVELNVLQEISPSKSAYVDQDNPTTNYQDYVQMEEVGGGHEQFGYLQWDITDGMTTADAAFIYFEYISGWDEASTHIYCQRVTSTWEEATVTYNTKPTSVVYDDVSFDTGIPVLTLPLSFAGERCFGFDITSLYNGWKAGTYTNYGIRLHVNNYGVQVLKLSGSSGTYPAKLLLFGKSANAGKVYKSDATNFNRSVNFIGFALNTATAGNQVSVQTSGVIKDLAGLTAGNQYYLTDTPGTISTTTGTFLKVAGTALSSSTLLLASLDSFSINSRNSIELPDPGGDVRLDNFKFFLPYCRNPYLTKIETYFNNQNFSPDHLVVKGSSTIQNGALFNINEMPSDPNIAITTDKIYQHPVYTDEIITVNSFTNSGIICQFDIGNTIGADFLMYIFQTSQS